MLRSGGGAVACAASDLLFPNAAHPAAPIKFETNRRRFICLTLAPYKYSCDIRRCRTDAWLVDSRVAHVLDNPVAACHHQDVQYNVLMALPVKALF